MHIRNVFAIPVAHGDKNHPVGICNNDVCIPTYSITTRFHIRDRIVGKSHHYWERAI